MLRPEALEQEKKRLLAQLSKSSSGIAVKELNTE